ncbi:hypothetical protein [Brachyspira innocens]|uniref:hypothetical protein n=1 Tax=Brachyspira innocens TaxID=13264 RepID=UPI0026EC6899|nr:hypothetical protein [Brachyspira innocens]
MIAPSDIETSTGFAPFSSALKNFQTALYLLLIPLTVYSVSSRIGLVTLLFFCCSLLSLIKI